MAEHYYTPEPQVKSDKQLIEENIKEKRYTFYTDAGVFSKKGIDFGSRLLIEHMDIPSHSQVLDVGCGYGVIGLAAAIDAAHGKAVMVDVNQRAVDLAIENAHRNQIDNVRIMRSNLFEALSDMKFSHILSNPPIRAGKQVVHQILEEAKSHLVDGGELWIVMQKKQGAPSALAKLEALYAKVQIVAKSKGYWVIKSIK